jgi:hypothetical protein
MDKSIRCSVCTWRGTWTDAGSIHPPRPSQIPGAMEEVQRALAEKQALDAQMGVPAPPNCPVCGHHTVVVKLHRSHAVT